MANVLGDFAAHRGTTAAATTSVQRETLDGHVFKSNRRRSESKCQANGQIRPSNAIRDAWNAGSRPHLGSKLPDNLASRYHSRQFGRHLGNPGLNKPGMKG